MAEITYDTKEDRRTSSVPEKNKVTASNMNEIKTSVNALYALVAQVYSPKAVVITAADFAGSNYVNTQLIGKTPQVDFNVYSNSGSGVLLKYLDGYAFAIMTGTLTMDAGDYVIVLNVKLTA